MANERPTTDERKVLDFLRNHAWKGHSKIGDQLYEFTEWFEQLTAAVEALNESWVSYDNADGREERADAKEAMEADLQVFSEAWNVILGPSDAEIEMDLA